MAIDPAPQQLAALKALEAIRQDFVKDRIIFIPRQEMIPILRALGATEQDFERLIQVSDQLIDDPTLPFRKSRNSRFSLDFEAARWRRLEAQPFILSKDDDFVRYDSGQVRIFDEVTDDVQSNTVFQALMKFQAYCISGVETVPRPRLDYDSKTSVCTLFHVRTTTNKDMLGEPALEGVHCDGVDFTMTTLVSKRNMRSDSAKTFVHSMKEKNGIRTTEADPSLILGSHQHLDILDTLLFVDNERKHSLTPLFAKDPESKAERDMFVFFTRKPAAEGHVSHPYDSFNSHTELRLDQPLYLI